MELDFWKAICGGPSMYVSSAPLRMTPPFSCSESCVDLLAWLMPIQKLGMASIPPGLTPNSNVNAINRPLIQKCVELLKAMPRGTWVFGRSYSMPVLNECKNHHKIPPYDYSVIDIVSIDELTDRATKHWRMISLLLTWN